MQSSSPRIGHIGFRSGMFMGTSVENRNSRIIVPISIAAPILPPGELMKTLPLEKPAEATASMNFSKSPSSILPSMYMVEPTNESSGLSPTNIFAAGADDGIMAIKIIAAEINLDVFIFPLILGGRSWVSPILVFAMPAQSLYQGRQLSSTWLFRVNQAASVRNFE